MEEEQENELSTMSLKGQRMAASLAEYLLMHYFFPEVRDRKR